MYVVDASVALKWVLFEAGSDAARRLLGSRLCAPDLMLAECANVLWKLQRRSVLSATEATTYAGNLLAADVEIVPHNTLVVDAVAIAAAIDHPAYDCFYLALARQRSMLLVTADRRLGAKLAGTDLAPLLCDLASI